MFYTVKLLNQEAIGNRLRAIYNVKDTCFEDKVTVETQGHIQEKESLEAVAILMAYVRRKRNVARNLALYYVGVNEALGYMAADKVLIDREFPTFNYGKQTFKLVHLYHKDIRKAIDDYARNEVALLDALGAGKLKLEV